LGRRKSMLRMLIQISLVLAIGVLWYGTTAMAFTVRLAPVANAAVSSTIPRAEESDLPTPQFFRIAIGRDGITFGVLRQIPRSPEPAIRFQGVRVSQPEHVPEARHARRLAVTPRLRGAELLLLRGAQMVAERQGE
jgi:hypothetical protein